MATAPATAAAAPPSTLAGRRLSSALRAPNRIAAAFQSSSKALRNRRSSLVVVASTEPEDKNFKDLHIAQNGSRQPSPPNNILDIPVEGNGLRRVPSKRYSFRLVDPRLPVRTMSQMLEAMDLVYDDVPAPPEMRRSLSLSAAGTLWAPWDVMEDEKEVRMRFDVPGLSKEEVKVTVEDNMLVIQGEHKKEEKGPGVDSQGKTAESAWWKERSFISYDMHILLPDYCDKKKVTAELRHGVLLINIPKIPGKREVVSVDVKG